MQTFQQITVGSSHLTRRHVILMAQAFAISREAMYGALRNSGLSGQVPGIGLTRMGDGDDQAREVLGDASFEETYGTKAQQPMLLRLNVLAAEAWKRELLTEGQLARLLHLDRVELRKLLDDLDAELTEVDDALELHG